MCGACVMNQCRCVSCYYCVLLVGFIASTNLVGFIVASVFLDTVLIVELYRGNNDLKKNFVRCDGVTLAGQLFLQPVSTLMLR